MRSRLLIATNAASSSTVANFTRSERLSSSARIVLFCCSTHNRRDNLTQFRLKWRAAAILQRLSAARTRRGSLISSSATAISAPGVAWTRCLRSGPVSTRHRFQSHDRTIHLASTVHRQF